MDTEISNGNSSSSSSSHVGQKQRKKLMMCVEFGTLKLFEINWMVDDLLWYVTFYTCQYIKVANKSKTHGCGHVYLFHAQRLIVWANSTFVWCAVNRVIVNDFILPIRQYRPQHSQNPHWANELPFIFIRNGFVWDKVITVINRINNVASINFECMCVFGCCVRGRTGRISIRFCLSFSVFVRVGPHPAEEKDQTNAFVFVSLNVYLFTTNLDIVDTKSLSQFQVYTQCIVFNVLRIASQRFTL